MKSLDLYTAVVTSVPFLLLALMADTRVFGPGRESSRRERRFNAVADTFALVLLFSAFLASLIELVRGRDDDLARMFAGYGLGTGALAVFIHVAGIVATLYQGDDCQDAADENF